VLLQDLADDALTVLVRADVALVHAGVALVELLEEALGRFGIAGISGRHLHAPLCEAVADGQPDAAYAAGHQGDLSLHVRHGGVPPFGRPTAEAAAPRVSDDAFRGVGTRP
jgi:hypothetical protein